MNKLTNLFLAGLLVSAACPAPLSFTQPPSMVKDTGASWRIDFALSDSTDVEVSIADPATGEVVRHLAAGVLGSHAPVPLIRNSLSQTLIWDSRDDYRQAVAAPANLVLRVRAGMSIALDNAAGGDPYLWGGSANRIGPSFYGFAQGSDGTVFLSYQPTSTASNVVRQYSATGVYMKTIFPIPGDQPVNTYSGWGLNLFTSTDYSPKTLDYYGPLQTTSPMGYLGRPMFVASPASGQLGILDDRGTKLWVMDENGSCDAAIAAATRALIQSPGILGGFYYGLTGPRFFTGSPDHSYFLMSGVCNTFGADTGFYRDGRIFKIDMATRVATVFYDLGSAQSGNSLSQTLIHGVAVDDSGNVFACDRLNSRILFSNRNGTLIKSIRTTPAPDDVFYFRSSGAVYATGRNPNLGLYLYKITDWRTDSALAVRTQALPPSSDMSYLAAGWFDRSYIAVVPSSAGTMVWLAYGVGGGIVLYQESGNAFTEYKSFRKSRTQATPYLKRMVVDPKTETAYLCATNSEVFKVDDWSHPSFKACSTLTGSTKRPLSGCDLAVEPHQRHLFVRTAGTPLMPGSGPFVGEIYRYRMGAYLAPAPLSRMGTNLVEDYFSVDGTMSVGSTDFGIAAAPNGHLASLSSLDYCSSSGMIAIRYHPVDDTQSAYRRLVLYSNLPSHPNDYPLGGGVRFDLKGNLYVGLGSSSAPVSSNLPSVITSDPCYKLTTGRINRYTGTGSLDGDLFTSAVSGPNKIYDVDFGQLGNSGLGVHCYCMTAMFGVDGWGRIYAPDGMFQKVTVLDNEGNRTARFGTYGNVDNVAVEVSGGAATRGKCYMSYPWDVDASDNYIYVSDPGNLNVLRYKKVFVLDNVPGLSVDRIVAPGTPLALFAAPNPLQARCGIRVVLPRSGKLTLDVVDVDGQLVKRITSGPCPAGVHVFNWDGGRIAAGLYFLRLASDAGNLTKRIVVLK